MRRTTQFLLITCAVIGLVTLWPADVFSQRRAARAPVARPAVVVSAHWGPFYPAYWQRYPSPYWYPYSYQSPYPRHYWFDYRSSLRIQGTPRDAEVYVNGYFVGIVDDFDGFAQRLYLEPGEHEIAVYLSGYRIRRELMLFRPGQSYRLRLALEPLDAGDAPEPRPAPGAGALTGPGDRWAGAPSRPRQAAPASLGTLSLRVQPADAVVVIDGERWEWPAGEDRLVVDVPEGTRRIEVHREGHQSYSTTVTVRRGEVTTLNVSLPRL